MSNCGYYQYSNYYDAQVCHYTSELEFDHTNRSYLETGSFSEINTSCTHRMMNCNATNFRHNFTSRPTKFYIHFRQNTATSSTIYIDPNSRGHTGFNLFTSSGQFFLEEKN